MEATLTKDIFQIDGARSLRAGSVKIGVPAGFGIGYLALRLASIASEQPDLSFELVALPRRFSLADREIDIAVSLDRPSGGDLVLRKLSDYALFFYATAKYRERYGLPGSVDELPEHQLCG